MTNLVTVAYFVLHCCHQQILEGTENVRSPGLLYKLISWKHNPDVADNIQNTPVTESKELVEAGLKRKVLLWGLTWTGFSDLL
jgi:hypothetical protein